MTSTTDIANLIEANTALKEYFESARDDLQGAINSKASQWSNLYSFFYVDQINGSSSNDGKSKSTPINDIQDAIDRTPFWSMCIVALRGNYETNKHLKNSGRYVIIEGRVGGNWDRATENRPIITLGSHSIVNPYNADETIVECFGIIAEYNRDWHLRNLDIRLPSQSQLQAAHPNATIQQQYLVSRGTSDNGVPGALSLTYCNVDFSDEPVCYALNNVAGFTILTWASTYVNSSGRIHPAIPAGSLPKDYGHLITTNIAAF